MAAALVALYALAGFLMVPRVLRAALLEDIPKVMNVTPSVGEIHINPFLLQLEIKDFALAAPGGEKLLGFGRLFVDFELSSIWHRAYSFGDIEIDAPTVNAIVAQDGNLNLLQLRPQPSAASSQQKSQPLPAIRIGRFKVSRGLVSYDDRSRPSEFATRLEPINFDLVDFTTGVDGGRFTFTGSSKLGERIEWHGHLSVQPIESDGEFQIDGLHAHTIWEYIEDRVNFAVNSGTVDLNATYKFSLQDALNLTASVSKIAVNDLAVRPKDSDTDWITVPALLLRDATMNLAQRQAHVDSLTLTGVKLNVWLDPDGSMNLLKLARAPSVPSMPGAPAVSTAPASPGAPWKFDLREFALKEAGISVEDRGTKPAAKVLLAPLSLNVGGASLDLAKPVSVALDARVNDSGSLSVNGDVTPQPLSANLALKMGDIELKAVQPYMAQHTSMTLLSGRLSAEAKLRYGATKPSVQVTGNLHVADLHTVDNALRNDFINWERLDVTGVSMQHDPDRVDIDQVMARKLYARVIIEPDASLNVKRVLTGPGVATPGAATPGVATPAPAPMPMSIRKIAIHASQANFADLSVQPNFATGIQDIEGTVTGLSSKINSRAKVDIRGAVDAFSPVAISGEVNVLSAALYSDLSMSFRNMELSIFNPYSGKFAGYNITKGKLTTELHYKVNNRQLDAQHHITVDQLEFGDKTASKDAVSLPIKLAVALLKDRNGVIDLDVPVNGTLDDPSFRLGPIIWKVFVNILEKAVTAPFALLGALFGGGPEMQFIDFQPGAADLDSGGANKVRAVVKALNERPQLKIEVPIAWVSDLDRPALVEAQFLTQVREAQSGNAGGKQPAAAIAEFAQLDPAVKLELLTRLYEKSLGGTPKFPPEIQDLKGKAELAAAKVDFLSRALHEHIVVADTDLTSLGQRRAMAVQQALLTETQVNPERVFLVVSDKAKNQDGRVRLELSLR